MNESLLLDQIQQLRTENAELARRLALEDTALKMALDKIDNPSDWDVRMAIQQALDNP